MLGKQVSTTSAEDWKPGFQSGTGIQDPKTGDVILSRKPTTWDGFFTALQAADVPEDFLSEAQRAQGTHDRDPLEGGVRPAIPCCA